jgi:hypothetical protein
MNQIRVSLSKTSYTGTTYAAVAVDIAPLPDNNIRVNFNPTLYLNFERGQRVHLTKPGNSDWDGEYYIEKVVNTTFTVLHLRWRAGDIVQSLAAGPGTGTITESTDDWTVYDSVIFDGEFTEEQEENYIFYRKKLVNSLKIIKDAYRFIDTLRDECFPYLIYAKIEKLCDGEWEEQYIGAFTINDIKWNLTRCTAEISPYTFDQYFSYFKLFRETNNIMEITTRYQAEFGGALQFGDRWIKLADLLDYFVGKNMYNVKSIQSDFFSINPVGYVYPVVIDTSEITNIMVSAMPDVNRFGTVTPTEVFNMSFFDFLENLRVVFGVYWNVVNGVFILENEYYFTSVPGLDITSLIINRKNEYTLDLDKVPRQEVFRFSQGSVPDFYESAIVYNDEMLSNQKDGGQKNSYVAALITTDLGWIRNVSLGSPDAQVPSDNGLALGAWDPVVNGGTGSYPLLANLTWHYLISRFHQYNRARITGYYFQTTVGRVVNTFLSQKKALLRKEITIKLCCEDFDPANTLTTEWGDAEIKSLKRNIYRGTMTLELLFELPC